MNYRYLSLSKELLLESGKVITSPTIGYNTYGKLNKEKNNVVWVFHALTANSNCFDWWSGLFKHSSIFPEKEYFIVCANILGSCYGTTGAESLDFPDITIRDMVSLHIELAKHLQIKSIKYAIGGSMGGYQALEWNIHHPEFFENLILIATSASESPWGKAIHESHRQALKNDPLWGTDDPNAGRQGLKVARGFGMVLYRSYEGYALTQSEDNNEKIKDFKACSYIDYQGTKFMERFNPYSYFKLLNALDTHNVGRNRAGIPDALSQISAKTLVLGFDSDLLCPISEQKLLAKHIQKSKFVCLRSDYGHDGFLVESESIANEIETFFFTNQL